MNRYEATLRIWREAKLPGDASAQLEHFRHIRSRIQIIPEGVDPGQTAELVLRLKSWIPGMTLDVALERVVDAIRKGIDPFMLEESLKFVVQAQGGFVRTDLGQFIFQYTLPQIRAGKQVWDMLPPQDRALIQVDTLLAEGLEEQAEVVALVIQELGSLQGFGLKIASLLKDCVCPPVAYELWKGIRGPGAVAPKDLELFAQAINAVGNRKDETEMQSLHRTMSDEETVLRFGRALQ